MEKHTALRTAVNISAGEKYGVIGQLPLVEYEIEHVYEGYGVYLVVRKAIASGKIALEDLDATGKYRIIIERVDNP